MDRKPWSWKSGTTAGAFNRIIARVPRKAISGCWAFPKEPGGWERKRFFGPRRARERPCGFRWQSSRSSSPTAAPVESFAMKKEPAIRILVADDHFVVRMGLIALVNTEPDMEVVGEAAD